jgi:membrane-associated protease RseP (regulator of RpoE activity)
MSMAALFVAVFMALAPAGADRADSMLLAQVKMKKVRVSFEGAKLVRVVKWVTKLTGKNFIIEDSLRDRKITILSGTSVTVEEAYEAFLAALEAEGLRVETVGKFLKITKGSRHRLHTPRADISMGDCPTPTGITKTGDYTYKIDREALDGWLENLACLGHQARIVPYFNDGKPAGFKLFAIRPNTLYSKLGIKNGDVMLKLNGIELSSPENALQAYQGLKDAKIVTMEILRRGKPKTLKYVIE